MRQMKDSKKRTIQLPLLEAAPVFVALCARSDADCVTDISNNLDEVI